MLGEAFTWTCDMFVPASQTVNAVTFFKDKAVLVVIGHSNNNCAKNIVTTRYIYACSSDHVYTLTIPAEEMTEMEQGSMWRCENLLNSSYRSSDIILKIASKIYFRLEGTVSDKVTVNIFVELRIAVFKSV